MLPGFKHRLVQEMKQLLQQPKYRNELSINTFKFHQLQVKENIIGWLGGKELYILICENRVPSIGKSRVRYL